MARPLLAFFGSVGSLAAITIACSDSSAPQTELARTPGRTGTPAAPTQPTLTPQQSGTTQRLQAISPVDDQVAWASGTGGTYALTTDGGNTWHAAVVLGAEALEFRDVQGVSDKVAYLLSAGPGDQSRVYKTKDGGEHWTLQFLNQDPNAFYDCFAFWTRNRGITTSDAVNGRFPAIKTLDGKHWNDIGDQLPAAQASEASFAASGTCVVTQGLFNAWIATGGAAEARILATTDGGKTWNAYNTPTAHGTPSSGVFSVDFRDRFHGILGAGELATPDASIDNVARSSDGGKTWELRTRTPFVGAIYGLSYVPDLFQTVVATGPHGAAWSPDEGGTWSSLPGLENFWAVAFASPSAGWLVGTEGRIVKVTFSE
jgi:photosystem II stability/assembly factor-like uncharacterized protein